MEGMTHESSSVQSAGLEKVDWGWAVLAGIIGAVLMHLWTMFFTGTGIVNALGGMLGSLAVAWVMHLLIGAFYGVVLAVAFALWPQVTKWGWMVILSVISTVIALVMIPILAGMMGGGGAGNPCAANPCGAAITQEGKQASAHPSKLEHLLIGTEAAMAEEEPLAGNPCYGGKNPCAGANPCASANPCAGANPCASKGKGGGSWGTGYNPCAPAGNPCAGGKSKGGGPASSLPGWLTSLINHLFFFLVVTLIYRPKPE